MSLLLITQTLLLPLSLSLLLNSIPPHKKTLRTISLVLIWLLPYFWIMGLYTLMPVEALDWLWLSSITILLISIIKQIVWRQTLMILIFITSLIIYGWPVIKYHFEIPLLIEMFFISLIAISIIFRTSLNSSMLINNPAIIICISSSGLAFVAAISSSLLIAQLAIVLAATLAGYVYIEFSKNKVKKYLNNAQLFLSLNNYLSLLFIGRVYAELPLNVIIPLALSPLTIVFISKQYNWIISLLLCIGAISWIIVTSDVQEYY